MLYQYNNIYTSLHKYLKGKKTHTHTHTHTHKNTNGLLEKKKNVAIVATVPLGTAVIVQNLGKKKWLTKPQNIFFLVVVGHNFIFYYFILTYKKLRLQ